MIEHKQSIAIAVGSLAGALLLGCANDPVTQVPKEAPNWDNGLVMSAQQTVSVDAMLARVRNPEVAKQAELAAQTVNLDPIVTLHYVDKQSVILPLQKQQLATLLTAFENAPTPSQLAAYIGPSDEQDHLASLRLSQLRASTLTQFFKEKAIEIQTRYDPHLPKGVVVVQLVNSESAPAVLVSQDTQGSEHES